MFSNLFSSSISFATVTPSLVMVGEPNDFSITTLRPLGPRVTFTASASDVDAAEDRVTRADVENDVFCHGVFRLCSVEGRGRLTSR